jgi:Acetyltransferase (GNAT) domain
LSEVIALQRLTLCPVSRGDAVFLLDRCSDPDVRHFLFGSSTVVGLWLIRKAHTNEAIGAAGLRRLDGRRLDGRGLELFYSIKPEHRGNGYATEVACGVVEFALARLGWMRPGRALAPRAHRELAGASRP